MNVESKFLHIKVLSLGEFDAELRRVNAPKTIEKVMQVLPIKGRAIKQGNRLIIPTELRTSKEKSREEFAKGDLSFDPSSGNMTIHLAQGTSSSPETYLGTIEDKFSTKNMPVTSTVIIKNKQD